MWVKLHSTIIIRAFLIELTHFHSTSVACLHQPPQLFLHIRPAQIATRHDALHKRRTDDATIAAIGTTASTTASTAAIASGITVDEFLNELDLSHTIVGERL
jgi:hypothetical protein